VLQELLQTNLDRDYIVCPSSIMDNSKTLPSCVGSSRTRT
jgi:hypothetical protein